MKVRFEFTIDEMIDVGERSLTSSRVVARLRRTGVVVCAVLAGVLAYAVLPFPPAPRLAVAIVSVVGAALLYPAIRKNDERRRLRAYWRERLAGDGPFLCEVELDDAGVTTGQLGVKSSLPWAAVLSILETSDSVDIAAEKGLLVVVRDRAFSSPEEKRRFVEFGRARLGPPRP